MALTNKTIAGTFKDLLHLNNSNNGVQNSADDVYDGNGGKTCLAVGKNQLVVATQSDSTSNVTMQNAGGDALLVMDGTNKLIRVNETQAIANTQYLRFFAHDIDVDNGTHIGVPLAGIQGTMPNANVTFGTSANPSAVNLNNNGDDWVHYLHYVDTNITVDAVNILVGATAASGDTLNFHLCSIATGDSTTIDEWSSTTIVADDSGTVNAGYEQFYRVALNLTSNVDVNAGNYLALTVEGNGTNSDYSVNALVRYHLR
tara:strand:+ start:3470 stop:4243 length:774 start_codon:yes stop_codon:yes gene_type:complete